MKRLVMDLDGTLTLDDPSVGYPDKAPNLPVIETLREYKRQGFTVVIATARNMRTHAGNVGLINAQTLPIILDWLKKHDVPFDEVHVGKPWCGHEGFHVDDKSLRPDEFVRMSYAEISELLNLGRNAV
ncbi:HAD hydrolase family protein [Roseomonas sp. BN140053]|uniref:HAD hydrolase family protein n=1 Tax=Roseomonas sp. BN140053 TaxID=3391898 RepID=UPI0039E826B2